MIGGPLDRARTGVAHVRIVAQAAQDADREVVAQLDLAGQSQVLGAFGEGAKAFPFRACHLAGIAGEDLDAAGCTASIAAAAVQDVDPSVFDTEHQAAPLVATGLPETLDVHVRHESLLRR